MNYFSDDRQDEFCVNLLKFKRGGYYLDIGSGASVGSNNTYFFESLDWKGICIEINSVFNESYLTRTCTYINQNALTVDYEKVFEANEFPTSIDYLSLDIDQHSTDALYSLPLDKYRFKVITIEHDSHFYGDKYKDRQRKILGEHGYFLLFGDVLNQSGRNIGKEHAWEDWWIDPLHFDKSEMLRLQAERLDTSQILAKLTK
jgi:hypothetical protein